MPEVKILRTIFLEDDVVDGDYPHDNVWAETFDTDDVDEAVAILNRHGVSFAATGNEWAADPDGSYISDYVTGERTETTAHLHGFTDDELAAIIAQVG